MLIKLGFWTPVLFFLTLKSGFPETSSQLTPSSTGESYELAGRDRYRFTARQQRGQQPSPLAKGADQDPASPDLALRAQ